MASRVLPRCAVATLILTAAPATAVEAQPYVGSGVPSYPGSYGPSAPGAYPYGDYGGYGYYGYPYLPFPGFFYPYASRYLPSYSYTPSPYMQVPGAAAYGTPPFTYSPFAYNYDLFAQSYADAYAQYASYPPYLYYPPPVFPYGPYYRFIPRRPRSPYRPMTLQEYLYRESRGPTRVRDIVPGVPELGG